MNSNESKKLVVKNLAFGYENALLKKELNTEVSTSAFIMLLGSNGSGKSTLIKTIGGLIKPVSGDIYLGNEPVSKLSTEKKVKAFSFVFPGRPQIDFCTVKDLVLTGRYPYIPSFHKPSSEDENMTMESLDVMNIAHLANKTIDSLSDGEFQKTMIARALAQQTQFMFLDEPTAFLDYKSKTELFSVLQKLVQDKHKSIVISTHEPHLAHQFGESFWLIENQKLHFTEDKSLMKDMMF
jgi:iron complex transport system ATP-binding protein